MTVQGRTWTVQGRTGSYLDRTGSYRVPYRVVQGPVGLIVPGRHKTGILDRSSSRIVLKIMPRSGPRSSPRYQIQGPRYQIHGPGTVKQGPGRVRQGPGRVKQGPDTARYGQIQPYGPHNQPSAPTGCTSTGDRRAGSRGGGARVVHQEAIYGPGGAQEAIYGPGGAPGGHLRPYLAHWRPSEALPGSLEAVIV